MNDILKRLLLAWLIHFSWMSVAEAGCSLLPPGIENVRTVPEKPVEGTPFSIHVRFNTNSSYVTVENISYEVLGDTIRIVATLVFHCPDFYIIPTRSTFDVDVGILSDGDYTVEVFQRLKDTPGDTKLGSTSLSVSARVEPSTIPSLNQTGTVLLTLLFFLVVMAHRYNYIDFNRIKDS